MDGQDKCGSSAAGFRKTRAHWGRGVYVFTVYVSCLYCVILFLRSIHVTMCLYDPLLHNNSEGQPRGPLSLPQTCILVDFSLCTHVRIPVDPGVCVCVLNLHKYYGTTLQRGFTNLHSHWPCVRDPIFLISAINWYYPAFQFLPV